MFVHVLIITLIINDQLFSLDGLPLIKCETICKKISVCIFHAISVPVHFWIRIIFGPSCKISVFCISLCMASCCIIKTFIIQFNNFAVHSHPLLCCQLEYLHVNIHQSSPILTYLQYIRLNRGLGQLVDKDIADSNNSGLV